jgi:hypothetical protein
MQKSPMGRGLKRAAVLGALYSLLLAWLTWPLAAHLGTHLPGTFPGSEFDPLYSGWVLAWQTHALVHAGVAIANANIYFPAPDALYYGPAALGALPLFAPVYLLTGNPTLALNLMWLGSIVLAATIIHLVVFEWTRLHTAGLVAAVTFLANRWLIYTFIPTVPHMAVLFYFPLIIALSAAPTLNARRALLLLALMVLQCSTDLVYITPAVLIPVSAVAIWHLARRATRPAGARLMIVAIAAGITVLAIHFPYLRVAASNPHLAQQTNWRLDPMRNAVEMPGGLLSLMSPFDVPSLALVLVVAVAALVLWRGWRGSARARSLAGHALLWVIVGLLISLPLRIDVLGSVWTLPHVLAAQRWIPFAAAIRLPERLRVAALMGITLLAGLAFAELLRHLASLPALHARARWVANGLAMLLAVAMYGQYVAAVGQPRGYGPPLPAYQLQEPPRDDSAVLRALRAAGGATIEVPLPPGQPTAAAAHAPAMYRSLFHWQPLLNGYSSYWPVDFAARMKVATRLPDRDALAQLQRETGLAYVLVRASEQLPIDAKLAPQRAAWLEIARNGGRSDLTLVAADDQLLLFKVAATQ